MVQQCLIVLLLAALLHSRANSVISEILPYPISDEILVEDDTTLSSATTISPNPLINVLDQQCTEAEVEKCSNCNKQCLCSEDRFNDSLLPEEIDLNEFLQRWNKIDDIGTIESEEKYTPAVKEDIDDYDFDDSIIDKPLITTVKPKISKPLSLEAKSREILDKNLFTDCTFVVGAENNTKSFDAHRVFFARISPVLEALFNDTAENSRTRVRIPNISPKIFEQLINFVYTGSICFETFSEACEMLHTASQLQIPELIQHYRAFLWTNLYPSNAWRGLQCAQAAEDEVLKEAALQIIAWRTDDAIKDPAFTDITHSSLVAFLKRDDLNVTSEVKLYEASLRWAMSEAARQGLPQEPESLRKVLGSALGLIRFFKFTPSEFANMQSTSKVLTYSESLSIIFNLNSPGVISIPKGLSTKNNSRIYQQSHKYFNVIATSGSTCKSNTDLSIENTFDLFTLHPFQISNRVYNLVGIQIPSQINCRDDLENGYTRDTRNKITYEEDVTVYVMKGNSYFPSILHSTRYKGTAKCDSLVTIPFTETVQLVYQNPHYTVNAPNLNKYLFKVVFHKSGRYPISWSDTNVRRNGNPQRNTFNGCSAYFWYFKDNEFVFSMIDKD